MKTASFATIGFHTVFIGALLAGVFPAQANGRIAAWGDNSYGQLVRPNDLKNVHAIAAGQAHSLALQSDGTVVAWGWNPYGLMPPANLSAVRAIAAADYLSLALRANGTVVAWGNNAWGQTNVPADLQGVTAIATGGAHSLALLGNGTVRVWGQIPSASYSNTVPAGLSNVTAIAAGSFHSVALQTDGTIVAWGNNSWGQTNVPPGLSNVVAIAAAYRHSLALRANGTVVAWGQNTSGQTNVPADLKDVIAIAAGTVGNLALRADGTLAAWGDAFNYHGLTNLPAVISNVTAIACGSSHQLALVAAGPPEILSFPNELSVPYQSNLTLTATATGYEPLSCQWYLHGTRLTNSLRFSGVTTSSLKISNAQFSDIGPYTLVVSNAFGAVQSTVATLTVVSPPLLTLQPLSQTVIAGTNLTLAAAAIGTPPLHYQWRHNDAPVTANNSPVLTVPNIQAQQSGNYALLVSNVYGVAISSNALITVTESAPYILLQPTNTVGYPGGSASFAVTARGSDPLQFQWRHEGTDLPGATNAVLTLNGLSPAMAGFYSVAISNALGGVISAKAELQFREAAVWGSGILSNVPPPDFTNLTAISAGNNFILGLRTEGRVTVWPLANSIPAVAPTNLPPDLNDAKAIAAGAAHGLVLRSNGTVLTWALGTQLVRPPILFPAPSPALITNIPAGLTNVVAIAAGNYHNLALQADGQLVSWGYYYPSSGYWFANSWSSATNVPPGLTNVTSIAAGGGQNLAVRSDGRVVAWGLSTAVPAGLSNVIAVACNDYYNLALRTDGTVVTWATAPVLMPIRTTIINTNVPSGLSNVVALAAGNSALALQADGRLVSWPVFTTFSTSPPTPLPPAGLLNIFAIAARGNINAALVGNGAPHITLSPAHQFAARDAIVRFSARAVGAPPLTYQWRRNGVNLPGATQADLILQNVAGSNAGTYQLVVANALGTATSAPALLTIPFSTNLATALNATNLAWTTSANAPWFAQNHVTHDGDVAAQSGPIGHNQQSTLETTVVGPGLLSFWWKVSSEEGYDGLWFRVDALNGATWISGERDWQQFTYPVPAGTHTLRWTYTKDATVSAGQDAAWLDQVIFTPAVPLALTAPRRLPGGGFSFGATAPGGLSFLPEQLPFLHIQTSTNLRDWITFPGTCTLTNGTLQIHDPDSHNHPQRFYRIQPNQ
jgi:alpha-tubulin suppressor-like RCC1 family protein